MFVIPKDKEVINSFRGQYRALSNFYYSRVSYDGVIYRSLEHAYQAAKTLDLKEREAVYILKTPGEAKKYGRQLTLRPDWESMKYRIMTQLVRDKFYSCYVCRDVLLDTGDAVLVEGNNWGDRVWGMYKGEGNNYLGVILMQVRRELVELEAYFDRRAGK